MRFTTGRGFGQLTKVLLDRNCTNEGLTGPQLADVLGLSPSVISSSLYCGQIRYAFIVTIAKRASATPAEFVEFEILWMRAKGSRPRLEAVRSDIAQVLHD